MNNIKSESFSRDELIKLKLTVSEFLNNVDKQWPGRNEYEKLSSKLDKAIGFTYMGDGVLENVGKWLTRDDEGIKVEEKND